LTVWRGAYALFKEVEQKLSASSKRLGDLMPVTLHEDKVIEAARKFVDTVERHFPDIKRQVFERIGIADDDVIAQALCCEVVLEIYQ
jgi:hypothetical protein